MARLIVLGPFLLVLTFSVHNIVRVHAAVYIPTVRLHQSVAMEHFRLQVPHHLHRHALQFGFLRPLSLFQHTAQVPVKPIARFVPLYFDLHALLLLHL